MPGAGLEDENPAVGAGAGSRHQSSSELWKGKLRTEPGTEPEALKMAQGDDKDVDDNGGTHRGGDWFYSYKTESPIEVTQLRTGD